VRTRETGNGSTGIRVWVDDPHPVFRRGLVASLGGDGFRVVGEGAGFVPPPEPARTDVLVFDAAGDALRSAATLAGVALVAIVRNPTEDRLCETVEAGVQAVLLHAQVTPRSLKHAVLGAAGGVSVVPFDLVPKLLDRAATRPRCHHGNGLTDRELRVLGRLAEGDDTRDIASELCYSERTVKNVVHDVLVKMNCRNRAHAVALATRRGLI
jgi:DNA-binding NarL/FixJ family response regulator